MAISVLHHPDSRRAIVAALKSRGSSTISELASSLHLTGEAVRQQLLALQREGLVEAVHGRTSGEKRPTGRPATSYRLTAAGEHQFPKSYPELTVELLDALEHSFGADGLTTVLAGVADERVASLEPLMKDVDARGRAELLRSFYVHGDPHMLVEERDDGFRLVERNCPYYSVALERPVVCSVTVNALERLFGFRVTREKTFQAGDRCCVFRVDTAEPVADPNPLRINV